MGRKEKKTNHHHLCWPKKSWSIGYAWALRNHWYLRIEMPRDKHDALHRKLDGIPAPKGNSAKEAYEQLELLTRYHAIHNDDSLEKRLELLINLFTYCDAPTARAFKKHLNILRQL